MDIQFFAGDKEVIAPLFEFKLDKDENILILGITTFNIEQQKSFLNELKKITDDNFILNSNYIAVSTDKKIYFFDISTYSDFKLENLLISGYHDFMFAFVDKDDKIISDTYVVMKLNEYKIKEL